MAAAVFEESVGDSSRNFLENLKRATKALLDAPSKKEDAEKKSLPDLLSERNKLWLEKTQLQAELHLRQGLTINPLKEESFSSETLSKRTEALEEELLTVKLKHAQENQLLECFHQHDSMMRQVFPKENDRNFIENSVQRSARQQSELASEFLRKSKEVEKYRMELSMLRRARASAQCECRELMARLDKLSTADNDSEAVHTKEQDSSTDGKSELLLHMGRDQVTLLRHTLLCLITASGVDWSQDSELCDLMQKLGDPTAWS